MLKELNNYFSSQNINISNLNVDYIDAEDSNYQLGITISVNKEDFENYNNSKYSDNDFNKFKNLNSFNLNELLNLVKLTKKDLINILQENTNYSENLEIKTFVAVDNNILFISFYC